MNFSDILKQAVQRVDGAVAGLIVGADGMPVEQHLIEDMLSVEELSAESSQILHDMNIAAETLKLGTARELVIVSDLCAIIVRKITEEYYLLLVVKAGGNYGKARFVLRTLAPKIEKEFV